MRLFAIGRLLRRRGGTMTAQDRDREAWHADVVRAMRVAIADRPDLRGVVLTHRAYTSVAIETVDAPRRIATEPAR